MFVALFLETLIAEENEVGLHVMNACIVEAEEAASHICMSVAFR